MQHVIENTPKTQPVRCGQRPRRRWQKSHVAVRDLLPGEVFKTYLVWLELTGGGSRRIAKRRLAAARGRCMKTVYSHFRVMARAGIVQILLTRKSRTEHLPNLYVLLNLDGSPAAPLNVGNFLPPEARAEGKNTLKEKAPAPPPVALPEKVENTPTPRALFDLNGRLMRENRELREHRHRERHHPPALRALHELNGRVMSENRGLRLILKGINERERPRRSSRPSDSWMMAGSSYWQDRAQFTNGTAGMNGKVCGLEPPTPEQLAEDKVFNFEAQEREHKRVTAAAAEELRRNEHQARAERERLEVLELRRWAVQSRERKRKLAASVDQLRRDLGGGHLDDATAADLTRRLTRRLALLGRQR